VKSRGFGRATGGPIVAGAFVTMTNEACFQPINGISLERYAELGAAIADANDDQAKIAEIVEAEGVALEDWNAAKNGWTARMQDMTLMGRVATAFMPMYQAALAKKRGGKAMASYEDFVGVSAAIKVFGYEVALKACKISGPDWTEIAGHWTSTMAARMMEFAGHPDALGREEARIRAGGQPRIPEVTRAPANAAANNNHQNATMPSVGQPMMQPMQLHMPVQMPAMQGLGLGFGLQQAAAYLSGGVVPGANVIVIHPANQQHYQARVLSTMPQHTLVQFPNGSQQWVPAGAVKVA
jgi:hypothetical protein